MRPLFLSALMLASTPARAVCDAPYTHDAWATAMETIDEALDSSKLHHAAKALAEARDQLPCLDQVADSEHLNRFATQMSLVYFYQGEEDASIRWARLVHALPEQSPHPAWSEMLEWTEAPMIGGPIDGTLATPRGGAVHMDGEPLLVPRTTAEVPHLVQLTDRRGEVIGAWWQDGARFRPDLLGDGLDQPAPIPATGYAAGGMVLTAGLLYGAAGLMARPVAGASGDHDDLIAARSRTNVAVMGAAIAGAGAVGLGITAVVQAKGLNLQVRF